MEVIVSESAVTIISWPHIWSHIQQNISWNVRLYEQLASRLVEIA